VKGKETAPSWTLLGALPKLLGPFHKIPQQLADQVQGSFIRKGSLGVELLSGITDHHFGLIDRKYVQEHENLAEMVLRPYGPKISDRSSHNRHGLPDQALSP